MKLNIVITFILCTVLSHVRADFQEGDLAELQCWLYASYGIFKLTSLEKMHDIDYVADVTPNPDHSALHGTTLTYNFCTYTQYEKADTFAYLTEFKADHETVTPLTNGKYRPSSVVGIAHEHHDEDHDH